MTIGKLTIRKWEGYHFKWSYRTGIIGFSRCWVLCDKVFIRWSGL